MDIVQWCSICSAAPSDGILKIENPFDLTGDPIDLECCEECMRKQDWTNQATLF